MLAGGASISQLLTSSIVRAMHINPASGTTFYDAEHVVLLMQENRSFDHAFGTYKGVRGFNDPRAILQPNKSKVWFQANKEGKTYAPFRLDIKNSNATWMGCLPHNWTDQTDAYHHGHMDKWLDVKQSAEKDYKKMPLTMGYYTGEDIPFYHSLADAFTICDQHFCSSLTGTNPNRLYFWTGNIREKSTGKALVWNGDSEFTGKANWTTFPERLSDLGVNWKVYQNEISSCSEGYYGQANSWLGNFGCNALEYFPQYQVKYSRRYHDLLAEKKQKLEDQLEGIDREKDKENFEKINLQIEDLIREEKLYSKDNFNKLTDLEKDMHWRALVNNSGDADYMKLETLTYQDGDQVRELKVPKSDIFYQFRKDVKEGKLPLISWMVPPQIFSDHPDSPWFGAWYVSEIMKILTENPEVWKKTIFILTYDENDGYFDHCAPFTAPNPYASHGGKVSKNIDTKDEYVLKSQQYHENSGRENSIGLGFRVPMIVASPWSRGGQVNSQIFDHTSCIQFLEKFVGHKTKTVVKETNISNWRRTVCGDLTSVFKPFDKEPILKPLFLDKNKHLKNIHQAQFKANPIGYKELTDLEITTFNHAKKNNLFSNQEPGIRDSCRLPYELYVNGYYDANGQYVITFEAANDVFRSNAVGSAFKVYSLSSRKEEMMPVRNYAVSAGDKISDAWLISDFGAENYQFHVYGPNGFFRSFKGNQFNPPLTIVCSYEKIKSKSDFSGKLQLDIYNHDLKDHEIVIQDISYNGTPKTIKLKKGSTSQLLLDISKQYYWYDVKVTCKGYENFEEQFAGRIEVSGICKTDPLMGAVL